MNDSREDLQGRPTMIGVPRNFNKLIARRPDLAKQLAAWNAAIEDYVDTEIARVRQHAGNVRKVQGNS